MGKLYSYKCGICGQTFILRQRDLETAEIGCSFCRQESCVRKNDLHQLEEPFLSRVKNAKRLAAVAGLTVLCSVVTLRLGGEELFRSASPETAALFVLVVGFVFPGIMAGIAAEKLGRRAWPWILAGMILSWIGLFALAASRPMNIIPQAPSSIGDEPPEQQPSPESPKQDCRHHFTWVTEFGLTCKVCYRSVSTDMVSEQRGKVCGKCGVAVHAECQHQIEAEAKRRQTQPEIEKSAQTPVGRRHCNDCKAGYDWWVRAQLDRGIQAGMKIVSMGSSMSPGSQPHNFAGTCRNCQDSFCNNHAKGMICPACGAKLAG